MLVFEKPTQDKALMYKAIDRELKKTGTWQSVR